MDLLPVLFAAVIVTGPGSSSSSSSRLEVTGPVPAAASLRAAATESAQHGTLAIGRTQPLRPLPARAGRRSGHYSIATRATAIFAGALIGAGVGLVTGGAMDKAASGGECLTFMQFGIPIGAGVGAVMTAHWLR